MGGNDGYNDWSRDEGKGKGGRDGPGECYDYRDKGDCRFGEDCKFTHDGKMGSGKGRDRYEQGRRPGPYDGGKGKGKDGPGECYDYRDKGDCRFGDTCRFTHDGRLGKSGGKGKGGGGPCYDFRDKGDCRFGNDCRFSH